MKEITEITSQKKGDRLNVYLDGAFSFGVEYETAVKLGLKKGAMLDEADEERIMKLEGETAAFERGLKYSVKKVVSEKQMRDYLHRLGFAPPAVEKAIARLKEYGYVDDAAFVKAYIATYKGSLGKRRLELGLKSAGVDGELIDEALSGLESGETCLSCVNKYLRTHSSPDRRKLESYLRYRGFSFDEINSAIEESGYETD